MSTTELKMPDPAEIEKAEQDVTAAIARTGRKCGSCSMCCKLLSIRDDPRSEQPITKPANEWCRHCRPGSGCAIYERRPDVCQTFTCLWLVRPELKDHWYPRRSQIVAHFGGDEHGNVYLDFEVEPAAGDRRPCSPHQPGNHRCMEVHGR